MARKLGTAGGEPSDCDTGLTPGERGGRAVRRRHGRLLAAYAVFPSPRRGPALGSVVHLIRGLGYIFMSAMVIFMFL